MTATDSTNKPGSKPSLFKKPSWAAPAPVEGDAVDFFSRSKESYDDIVADDEEKRRIRAARKVRRQVGANAERSMESPREGKRRRIQYIQDGEDDRAIDCDSKDNSQSRD